MQKKLHFLLKPREMTTDFQGEVCECKRLQECNVNASSGYPRSLRPFTPSADTLGPSVHHSERAQGSPGGAAHLGFCFYSQEEYVSFSGAGNGFALSFHFISDIYERHLVYKAPFRHRERNVMTFRGPVSKDFIFLAREVDSTTER